jgi:endoglucanase
VTFSKKNDLDQRTPGHVVSTAAPTPRSFRDTVPWMTSSLLAATFNCLRATRAGAARCALALALATAALPALPGCRAEPELPRVRINQLGYFPAHAKLAVLVSDAAQPAEWTLVAESGAVAARGRTVPTGLDADSGDALHAIDFSDAQAEGRYVLRVGGDESAPFRIARDLYAELAGDALAYFYHNRSGIEIVMPFAGDAKWARPAGHLSDERVACAPDAGCDYALDVRGGWYDAGDHGKYAVNGGIAVWTLMNQYERAAAFGGAAAQARIGDGALRIPERANGVPDLLDEARWEMEWLLRMQVPEGQPRAGMVHHKVHDDDWTPLGTPAPERLPYPSHPEIQRFLRPVSTAATLNLAATGAQCARVFAAFDTDLTDRCRRAAERAWQAAVHGPAAIAPASDGKGGGAYDDDDLSDDFYWAATELYLTTQGAQYAEYRARSDHAAQLRQEVSGLRCAMNWADTDALGTLSLAVATAPELADEPARARAQITAAADEYLAIAAEQGYRVPLRADANGAYPWGSNSFLLNNLIVLALAYDFTGRRAYLEGAISGMDYLLGRNPMDQSYVTGYGARPLRNPHHRFWCPQVRPDRPAPPPGAVSGGPNSGLQDPQVKAAGLAGCKPQKCFLDHVEAWSANEVTINWNAPLAWIAAWLDERAR